MSTIETTKIVACIGRGDQDAIRYGNQLTLQGKIVLFPFEGIDYDSKASEDDEITAADITANAIFINNMMKAKIDLADEVYVINTYYTISDDMQKLIKYARSKDKPITYLNPIHEDPYIVTLCGSRKFIEAFKSETERLTKQGKIVFTPAIFNVDDPSTLTAEEHLMFDAVHQQKMLMSDEVRIINVDGYIGDNTREELEYAKSKHMFITYLDEIESEENWEIQNGK